MFLHKKYDRNYSEMRCIFRLKVYLENILQKSMFYFVHCYSTKVYFINVFLWMHSALNDFRLFCDIPEVGGQLLVNFMQRPKVAGFAGSI